MGKLSIFIFILLFSLLPSPSVVANWLDAFGSAVIEDGDIDKARQQAINQAVSFTTLEAGINIDSQQEISNGQLTLDKLTVMRQMQASQIKIISETISGNTLKIHLQVNLDKSAQNCKVSGIKAGILIPQAILSADRSQLNYGQLYGFESAISKNIALQLDSQSRTTFSHIHADETLDLAQELVDIRGYQLPTWLLENTNSQYLLLPYIENIAISYDTSVIGKLLGFLGMEQAQRAFKLQLSLFHGVSGEKIWSNSYHTQAKWGFTPQDRVAPASDAFWKSNYGKSIKKMINQSIIDLDNALLCRPVIGQIIARDQQRILINLGRKHGIQIGDKFSLALKQDVPDRLEQFRTLAHKSEAEIEIDKVSEFHSSALLVGKSAALNIQISDIAVKQQAQQ